MVIPPHQPLGDGLHRLRSPLLVARAGEHGPRLGQGSNLAFVAFRRPQGRAVVVVRAAVPFPIPGALFQRVLQGAGPLPVGVRLLPVPPPLAKGSETSQRSMKEPPQPDALAPAPDAHPVHAVVPIPAAHQRQPMWSCRRTCLQCPTTVLVECGLPIGEFVLAVALLLVRCQGFALAEGHLLVQDRLVAGGFHVFGGHVRQPQQIVGDARPHPSTALGTRPPSRRWVPPV